MKNISAFTTLTVSSLPGLPETHIPKNDSAQNTKESLVDQSESLTQEQYIIEKLNRDDLTSLAQYCLGSF
ncbi:hypothetical protein Lepto7376_1790 [[Leptolyngbya] sp. PCC 7376]|nr:hypothetical protein Lepto7376_1790 [[Leptolyngbya] sp. PCC 7376]